MLRAAEIDDLLAHVSTADTARDLDHLRQLVGDEQLTYRGIACGTFIGQTYASMFPGRVRAMVLWSTLGNPQGWPERAAALTQDGYGQAPDEDPSSCVNQTVSAYRVDLVAPPRGTVCPSDRVPFDPDFGEPPAR